MASVAGEFTAFVQEVPIIQISGGVVLVRYRSGVCCHERAMSVAAFTRALDRGNRALKRYSAGEQTVIIDD